MFGILRFFFLISSLSWSVNLFGYETIYIPRHDESLIEAYLSAPSNTSTYPIVLLVQGSDSESVVTSHEALISRFLPLGIAVISVEKRGISSSGVDTQEFIEYDFFESRLHDFSSVLKVIEEGLLQQWNGHLILIGGSEGGKIAPRLARQYAHFVSGVVLVGSGGGIPFAEEMKFQVQTALDNQNAFLKICWKIRNLILPKEIDSQYQKILNQPSSLEMWCTKTFRWWASYLRYDPLPDLLQLNMPIYMIQGVLDPKIPVQSADLLKWAFDCEGKKNLTYARYDDLGHAMKGRDDVYCHLLEWVKSTILKCNVQTNAILQPGSKAA